MKRLFSLILAAVLTFSLFSTACAETKPAAQPDKPAAAAEAKPAAPEAKPDDPKAKPADPKAAPADAKPADAEEKPAAQIEAPAFTDAGAIAQECAEAVEILSRFKVVGGFPDGSFKPTEKLTRAQAAKILCCVALGVTAAEAISAVGSTFRDVPPSHWANKFVEYCAAKNIVAGVGSGKFNPDSKLTGYAFGKMLLVALGTDSSPFTGKGWDENVKKHLAARHLDYGVTVGKTDLDRQTACRLALNALFDGESKNAESTLAYKSFGVVREQIGLHAVFYHRPVVAYFSSTADTYWPGTRLELTASPARVIPTGPVTGGAFVAALGVSRLTADKLDVYRSGLRWDPKTVRDVWKAGSDGFYALSGDGIRLEFYCDARTGHYTVLHVPTFCRKITAVTEPVKNADGSVKTPGSVTFEDLPPLRSNAFKSSDVGGYGLFRGTAEKDWRRPVKVVEAVNRTVVTGKLTAYEPMVSVSVDKKMYRYPYQDLVARGAEKVVFEDDKKIGDTVHAVIDELGFCYAVWK